MREFIKDDIVVIKDWDEMAGEFEHDDYEIECEFGFYKHMRHLCGNKAKITSINGSRIWLEFFEKEPGLDYGWSYSTDMIRHYYKDDKDDYIPNEDSLIEFIMG